MVVVRVLTGIVTTIVSSVDAFQVRRAGSNAIAPINSCLLHLAIFSIAQPGSCLICLMYNLTVWINSSAYNSAWAGQSCCQWAHRAAGMGSALLKGLTQDCCMRLWWNLKRCWHKPNLIIAITAMPSPALWVGQSWQHLFSCCLHYRQGLTFSPNVPVLHSCSSQRCSPRGIVRGSAIPTLNLRSETNLVLSIYSTVNNFMEASKMVLDLLPAPWSKAVLTTSWKGLNQV